MNETQPNGWVETTLDNIADWGSGGTPKSTEKKYYDGNIPWLIIADLNNGIVTRSNKRITENGLKNSSAKWVEIGAVLIAMYGSIGKLGIAGIRCTTNQAIAFTTSIWGGIPNWYLFYYLKYQEADLLSMGQGGAQKNISQTILKKYPIPIPPLNEQKRIVAKLDQIMPRIDEVKERLGKVPKIVKRFKQAVLIAAVAGKLTEKWRKQHKVEIEWEGKKLQDMAEYQGGFAFESKRFNKAGNNQVIKIANVKRYGIDITLAPAFIDDQYALEACRFRLMPGDVIISMTGTRNKRDYGFNAIVQPDTIPLFLNQRVSRLRCNKSSLLPEYLSIYMKTPDFREFFFKDETGNVNQGNIGADALKLAIIPTPHIEEQREIIRQVNKLFIFADRLETHYRKAKATVDKISQSVLAKAFRGELVINETELAEKEGRKYESAEKLLERILKEKEKLVGKKAGGRGKKPNGTKKYQHKRKGNSGDGA
ncbi:MAG: restriction endonuclease subunit S [Candidatus Margulisiibacteriota bacterium]